MNTDQLIARVRNILATPKTEWPVIAAEPDSVAGLYTRYIMILSAIPALAGFIKGSLIGYSMGFAGTFRLGFVAGLTGAVLQYGLGLAAVYLVALIINALAPTFGGQKDMLQALKTTAYAFTASWIASIAIILPWFGTLISLLGAIYGIYLLYLGLPITMRGQPSQAAGYTAVSIICAILVMIVLSFIIGSVTGIGSMMGGMGRFSSSGGSGFNFSSNSGFNSNGGSVKVDPNSPMAQIGAMAQAMQANSQKLEQAQKSGDVQAQQQAAGQMMSGLFSGGAAVEALSPEQLKPFIPESLNGLARKSFSVQRNAVMGMQTSEGQASYRDDSGAHSVNLQVVDMGGAKGLTALAGWAVQSSESESDTGYDKVYQDSGRMIHEQWNRQSNAGTLTLIIGGRFSVELQCNGLSMEEIKSLASSLNLSGLEALKQSGVKPG